MPIVSIMSSEHALGSMHLGYFVVYKYSREYFLWGGGHDVRDHYLNVCFFIKKKQDQLMSISLTCGYLDDVGHISL